jgi:hypothetical protein
MREHIARATRFLFLYGVCVRVTAELTCAKTPERVQAALEGCDAVISAVGFVPGSPFDMQKKAHAVDNVGTCALIVRVWPERVRSRLFALLSTNGQNPQKSKIITALLFSRNQELKSA